MKFFIRIFVVGFGLFLIASKSFADENQSNYHPTTPTQENTLVTNDDSTRRNLLDHFYVNYFAIYHGASLSGLSSPHTVDNIGNPSKMGIYFDSEITTAYMIDSKIGIGPDIPFLFVPVLGQGFILGDMGLKVFDAKTLKVKNFNLYTNLILQGATSKASADRNMTLGVKTTPSCFYSFPGSRFTVGTWSEIKAYLGVTYDKTFKLYGAPYVNYRLTPKLSLNLEYEIEAHHDVGHPTFEFNTYQTDIEPGFVWNITPKILINPYIQFFTNNKVTMDTTSVGAVISATVL